MIFLSQMDVLNPGNFQQFTNAKHFTISGCDRLRSYKLYHLWRHQMRFRARVIWFLLMPAILVSLAQARVVRVEITSRADIQEGKPFGNAGVYEKIIGRVYFAVDPANLHNRQIVDLDK